MRPNLSCRINPQRVKLTIHYFYNFYNLQLQVEFCCFLIFQLQVLHVFRGLNLVLSMLQCENGPHHCIHNVEIRLGTKFRINQRSGSPSNDFHSEGLLNRTGLGSGMNRDRSNGWAGLGLAGREPGVTRLWQAARSQFRSGPGVAGSHGQQKPVVGEGESVHRWTRSTNRARQTLLGRDAPPELESTTASLSGMVEKYGWTEGCVGYNLDVWPCRRWL